MAETSSAIRSAQTRGSATDILNVESQILSAKSSNIFLHCCQELEKVENIPLSQVVGAAQEMVDVITQSVFSSGHQSCGQGDCPRPAERMDK